MPTKVNIDFIKFARDNKLHYKLKKSLTEYFIEININTALTSDSNEIISVNFPKTFGSDKDFNKKTTGATINNIYNKHLITEKMLSKNNLDLFKSNLINAYNKLLENLKNEYKTLRKEFSKEIKQNNKIKKNLKEIDSIISDKKYHQINSAFDLIVETQKYAKEQLLIQKEEAVEAKAERKEQRREILQIVAGIFISIIFIALLAVLVPYCEQRRIEKENKSEKEENAITIKKNSSKNAIYSGMDLIFVKGGTFEMGTNDESNDAQPEHTVRLSDFYLSKYEITNRQFCRFLNEYGSIHVKEGEYSYYTMFSFTDSIIKIQKSGAKWIPKQGYENHPVCMVNWLGANEYCKWYGGSLPTEAQWEFAAKGGIYSKAYKFSGSNDINNVGWIEDNSEEKVYEVGLKNPNEIGLYDMSGNLKEWTKDAYENDFYKESPEFNPYNDYESDKKTIRGSGFKGSLYFIYIESRYFCKRTDSRTDLGFRFCYNGSIKTSK